MQLIVLLLPAKFKERQNFSNFLLLPCDTRTAKRGIAIASRPSVYDVDVPPLPWACVFGKFESNYTNN